MFDENFSFLNPCYNPSSRGSNAIVESPELSPFSSRCPSPVLSAAQPFHAPLVIRQRDNRFNSRSIRPSLKVPSPISGPLDALPSTNCRFPTTTESASTSALSSNVSTPNTDPDEFDLDTHFVQTCYDHYTLPDELNDPKYSCYGGDLDLPTQELPTSHPVDPSAPSFALRRRQRQSLSRLQCVGKRIPDLAILAEERHPSSLPLSSPVVEGETTKGRSSGSRWSGGRIQKERRSSAAALLARRMSTTSSLPRGKPKPH